MSEEKPQYVKDIGPMQKPEEVALGAFEDISELTIDNKIVALFDKFCDSVTEEIPEIRSMGLIIDWKIAQSELPSGTIYVTDAEKLSSQATFGLIDSTRKMFSDLLNMAEQATYKVYKHYKGLLGRAKEAKEYLDELQAEVNDAEAKTQTTEVTS